MLWKKNKETRIWTASGIFLGFLWFLKALALPLKYKGWTCCDALQYVHTTIQTPSLLKALTFAGERTFGYVFFLKLHQTIYSWFASDSTLAWADISLFTVLFLHFWASWSLYQSVVKNLKVSLHPIFLFLILIHPGLTSYAAVTLTDTITTAFISFSLAWLIEGVSSREKTKPYLIAGLLLGTCAVIRPIFNPIGGLILFGVLAIEWMSQNSRKLILKIGAPLFLGFILISGMGFRNCWMKYRSFCMSDPSFTAMVSTASFKQGLSNARLYTSLEPAPRCVLGFDKFMLENFDTCPMTGVKDLLKCYARKPVYLPLYFIKKSIGLFDNFYLGAYAFDITRPWEMVVNRSFGMIGFVGFLLACFSLLQFKRKQNPGVLILSVVICIHVLVSIQFHIESRYGFPAVPAAFLVLGTYIPSLKQNWKSPALWIALLGAIIFWWQTLVWD